MSHLMKRPGPGRSGSRGERAPETRRASSASLRCLAVALLLGALLAHHAVAKGGQAGAPSATLEFEDGTDDAIRSDGSGSYEASFSEEVDGSFAEVTVSLGSRQDIRLDFSDCDPVEGLSCDGAFGPDSASGSVAGATIRFTYGEGAWEHGVTFNRPIDFEFRTSEGSWRLRVRSDVTPYDEDDDGAIDRWAFASDGATSATLYRYFAQRRGPGKGNYLEDGRFFMPWAATLRVP